MLTRRSFIHATAAGLFRFSGQGAPAPASRERLYNGIELPAIWPPRLVSPFEHPVTPPYLADPPAVIPIDVGRQLFVDDFLIARTNMRRTAHQAQYDAANPVLRPERPWELRDEYADRTKLTPNPAAMAFSDGAFFDPQDRLFKLWYMGGYAMTTCLALSDDGITWRKPDFGVVPGTNIVSRRQRDSTTVWLDHDEKDATRRFKFAYWWDHTMKLHVSPDGIHWRPVAETPPTGDRTTFFYNPFRRKWVFSIRAAQSTLQESGRYRQYWEHSAFDAGPFWGGSAPVAWVKADSQDFSRMPPPARPELYSLDCVAYESVMLGLFVVWRGESENREKINEIVAGYSRDGFHWVRPDRRALLPVSDVQGSWNYANVQSAGGCCLIVGDELRFYVSGRAGRPGTSAPGVCATGLARLRRDGFASMDWLPDETPVVRGHGPGTLTTRVVQFTGRHPFVNADATGGELRVEITDEAGNPIAPFSIDRSVPITGNATRLPVSWHGVGGLEAVAGRPVRFRFQLTRGRLYAFWVSPWATGESQGYPAAGGPAFSGPTDRPSAR